MEGHVYLDVTQIEDGDKTKIAVDCELENVSTADKFELVNAVFKALHMKKQEWLLYTFLCGEEL